MKRGVKIYLRSLLYSLSVFVVACLLSLVYCKYKFAQLQNPEYVRKLLDIELPAFMNVETKEDDDYPINHNSYSIWHIVEFATPLSETAIQKIEQVRSKEKWPYWIDEGGWGLFYLESEYQYVYIDCNVFRRLVFKLSTTKANIYYEVWDSFYLGIILILLLTFILLVTVMTVWGLTLLVVNIARRFNLCANK